MKDIKKVKMGKASRAAGKAFELKVRHDLESKGWIVCKFDRNVEDGKLIIAKHKFNFFTKSISAGNGFPDFIAFKPFIYNGETIGNIQLVESKMAGKLDKIEKEKIEWIKLNLKIPCFVASKDGRNVKYEQA